MEMATAEGPNIGPLGDSLAAIEAIPVEEQPDPPAFIDEVVEVAADRPSIAIPAVVPAPRGNYYPSGENGERPPAKWIRGKCPECGDDLVSNLYYVVRGEGKGSYLIAWECWSSLSSPQKCTYRRYL
jgi:hypothetical protein